MGTVTGTVTMDGQPLPDALVTFTPEDGGIAATGITDASGQYQLISLDQKGAVIGKHKVVVTSQSPSQSPGGLAPDTPSSSPEYAQQATGGSVSDYNAAAVTEPIPARYNKQSQLVEEVTSGNNVIDLKLESGG